LGWLFAIWENRRHDREKRELAASDARTDRKRQFRANIKTLCENVVTDADLFRTHRCSLKPLREECAKIEADITDKGGFRKAVEAHCSLTQEQIEPRDQSRKPPSKDAHGNWISTPCGPPPDLEAGRKALRTSFDAICRFAE
jgi:hypothetical protein